MHRLEAKLVAESGSGQTFYREEADFLFPGGCKCGDRSGDCDWCFIYYHGIMDVLNEQKDKIKLLEQQLASREPFHGPEDCPEAALKEQLAAAKTSIFKLHGKLEKYKRFAAWIIGIPTADPIELMVIIKVARLLSKD